MYNKVQIGWLNLPQDEVFCDNGYECAAWFANVDVKAGRFPLYVYDPQYDARGQLRTPAPDMAYAELTGTVKSDYFGSLFCGVPIGTYDETRNKGKESSYTWSSYLYDVAEAIGTNKVYSNGITLELLPEFKAVQDSSYWSDYNKKTVLMYHIYRRDEM